VTFGLRGELSIEVGTRISNQGRGRRSHRLPSTTLHEVVPVRSGQRLVSITFIESFIADQHQRTQVYELNEIAALEGLMKWESRATRCRTPESDADVVDDLDFVAREAGPVSCVARKSASLFPRSRKTAAFATSATPASDCARRSSQSMPFGSPRGCRGASRDFRASLRRVGIFGCLRIQVSTGLHLFAR
jgi:hypothetical protein